MTENIVQREASLPDQAI